MYFKVTIGLDTLQKLGQIFSSQRNVNSEELIIC